ncbi:MAG: SurA N-terminal domain-containing protein, partial [Candidatus Krumholzibacteriota bacterium]
MKKILILFTLGVFTVIAAAGCSEEKGKVSVESGLAARVAGEEITEQDVDRRFKALPQQQKKEFSGEVGRAKLIDQIIEEKLAYRAALDNKLQYRDQVKQQLDYSREMILIRAYYNYLADQVEVTDKEIREYYESHPIEFRAEPTLRAQHLFTTDSL